MGHSQGCPQKVHLVLHLPTSQGNFGKMILQLPEDPSRPVALVQGMAALCLRQKPPLGPSR